MRTATDQPMDVNSENPTSLDSAAEIAALKVSFEALYDTLTYVRSLQPSDPIDPDRLVGPLALAQDEIVSSRGRTDVQLWKQVFEPAFSGLDFFKKQAEAGVAFNESDWFTSIESVSIALRALKSRLLRGSGGPTKGRLSEPDLAARRPE